MIPDLQLIVGLAGLAGLHLHLRRRAVRRGGAVPAAATWRLVGALAALLVALGPQMEGWAERSLAGHMVQHQLLVLLAAPLLASCGWGRHPVGGGTRPTGRLLPSGSWAVAACVAHLGVMLAWHVPAAYDAALASPALHQLEHLTMLATAVVAWFAVLRAADDERAVFGAVLGLAALAIGGAALGVVLLSTPVELYGWYGAGGSLGEQRVAGALMKVGALLVYAGAATVVTARWFHRLAHSTQPLRPPSRVGGEDPD